MRRLVLCLALLLGACSPVQLLNVSVPFGPMRAETGIAYGPLARQKLDIYRPAEQAGPVPMVVFFYGGNWRTGERGYYRFIASALTRRGMVVVIPDYREYPEAAFPSFIEDGAAATAWAAAHAAEYGADPRAIYLAGHSAGAHIALMLALNPAYLADAGYDRARLAGAIGLAGPYDFVPAEYPDAKPVFAPAADQRQTQPVTFADAGAPRMLLATGTEDTTVMPRNTRSLAAVVTAAGGQVAARYYPEVGHAGILMAMTPAFRHRAPVLADISAFIGR